MAIINTGFGALRSVLNLGNDINYIVSSQTSKSLLFIHAFINLNILPSIYKTNIRA